MTLHVKAQREALQLRKHRGLITQFVIFVVLRTIDIVSSLLVLTNAWEQSKDWAHLDTAFTNVTWNVTFVDDGRGVCREASTWSKEDVDSVVTKYNTILGLTAFFNALSIVVFIIHSMFWIATFRILIQGTAITSNGRDDERITRLTRNSLLSLMTAAIRDVPLSCLNTELLVLRSGRAGLVCVRCVFLTTNCSPQSFLEKSLSSVKVFLYFSYATMLVNSLWKGVSGFYRLTYIEIVDLHIFRACAAIMFAFLYCTTTFTPAMLIVIYRYFPIPGLHSQFLYDVATKVVVVGSVVWIIGGSALVCCPILNAIKLTAD